MKEGSVLCLAAWCLAAWCLAAWCLAAWCLAACSGGRAPEPALGSEGPAPPAASTAPATEPAEAALAPRKAAEPEAPSPSPRAPEAESPCPKDMAYVDAIYCEEVERRCVKDEYSKENRITLCHEFAPGTKCRSEPRRQRFCIDRYEYPNREGAHPPVMVDWYDAQAMCAEQGKRLCWESEWVSACEGPEMRPFPYGQRRDPKKCNIDNPWRGPSLSKVYASDREAQAAELARLDQGKPSGAMAECKSDFGVFDLTGNFDEWVIADRPKGKGKWAALKGGAWGHVRNACRPTTTSHAPEFQYYFVSFRCCKDAVPEKEAAPREEGAPKLWEPPPVPDKKDPSGVLGRGWPPAPPP